MIIEWLFFTPEECDVYRPKAFAPKPPFGGAERKYEF
jgi:hypothetical protein